MSDVENGQQTLGFCGRGWWSSYLLGVSLPCASVDEGRAAVEAAWADWMARAGLVWGDRG
jgi:hypothetical protein